MNTPTRFIILGLTLLSMLTTACQENPAVNTPEKPMTSPPFPADDTPASPDANKTSRGDDPGSTPVALILQQRPDRVIAELPNRMILIAQDVPTAPVVSVQAWIKTGSLYEQEHVGAGLSHFLEHLISGGTTTNRPEADSTAALGAIGAQTNAATSLDTVRYYINTTSTHTATAIDLLTDWMQNSVITDTEYQRERDVIQREFSMGQGDPGRIHWKLTQQARFAATPTHPGAHPTIGYLDEFLGISRDEIYDFYKRMYVPNNMVFAVTGDIDPAEVVAQLTTLWADQPTGELPALSFPVPPKEDAGKPVEVSGVAAIARPRVRLLWPGVKLGSEHDYALDLLSSILGGGESSRLVRDLRDNQQLVTSIDAYNYSAHWGKGFFGIDYELTPTPAPAPAPGNSPKESESQEGVEQTSDALNTNPAPTPKDVAATVRTAIAAQLDRLRVEPVTPEELARAKRQTLARVLKSGQSAEGIASLLVTNIISAADPDYSARYAAAVQDLTADDLMAAANAIIDPDGPSIVRLNPAIDPKDISYPTRPPAVAEALDLPRETVDLDNYRLVALLKENLARRGSDVAPLNVQSPEVRDLANGLTVIVQRSTIVPAVSMQLFTKGGLLADTPGREGVANAAYTMMMRGTETRSAQQLAAAVEDLGASLDTSSGNNTDYIRASALSEDWPTVMQIMADVLLRPAFAEDEWAKLKPRLLAAIDRSTEQWSGELRSEFLKAYYGDHPWSQLSAGRRDVVESLTTRDLAAFHDGRLNAADSVLAVVGDVEPEKIFAMAAKLFGEMPATAAVEFALPQPQPPTPGLTVIETAKPVAAVQLGYGPGLTRDSSDYAAVQVLSKIIGDFPAGWLQQELRGRGPGLVYASSAGAATGLVPGYFTMLFNTQPETVDDALERTVAVAERARSELVDEATLARAKAKVLTNEYFGRQTNADLAAGQALDLLYGIDDLSGRAFLQEVEALTAKDIRAVARKYLNEPVVVVITNEPVDETALRKIIN